MTPATRRYKAHSYAINTHEVNTLTGKGYPEGYHEEP